MKKRCQYPELLCIFILLLFSCQSKQPVPDETNLNQNVQEQPVDTTEIVSLSKLDAIFQNKIQQLDDTTRVRFSAVCNYPLSEVEKDTLQQAGITVHTISGTVFTASGNKAQINQLLTYPFIQRLEGPRPIMLKKF